MIGPSSYEKCYGQDHARVLGTKTLITDLPNQQDSSISLPAGADV